MLPDRFFNLAPTDKVKAIKAELSEAKSEARPSKAKYEAAAQAQRKAERENKKVISCGTWSCFFVTDPIKYSTESEQRKAAH